MKKTLLAAALTLGFAGVAQAETSVTLYGIIDAGIGYEQIKYSGDDFSVKSKRTGLISGVQSGSRWGLKGVEDLGNGLRAVFVLESGFDIGTGKHQQGDRLFGRQATLGLAGDSWGQLDLGRQTNIASKYLPGVADPFGGAFGSSAIGATFSASDTVRYDNMIMYQTPNFSGFQFGVGYSFSTDGAQRVEWSGDVPAGFDIERNSRAITTGLRYANGPIGVALTYDQLKTGESYNPLTGDVDSTNVKAWALGGSYDFEVVKAYAHFGQTRNGVFPGSSGGVNTGLGTIDPTGTLTGQLWNLADTDGLKFNSYSLGLSAPIGAGTILASWQVADPRSNPDSWDSDVDDDLSKQQTYSLGYTYGLSKRTNVYAIANYSKNVAFIDGLKSQMIGVGIRHQF